MASTDPEDGFTKIASGLLDEILIAGFSKRELLVLLAVARKTYGYGKKTDDMTMTQIAEITGIRLSHVSETVRGLAARNVFLFQEGRYGYVLGINRHSSQWAPSQNGKQVPETGRFPKREQSLPETGTSGSQNGKHNRQPQKTTPIETMSGTARRVLAHLNEKADRNYQAVPVHLEMIGTRLKEGATEQDCLSVIDRMVAKWKGDPKMESYLRPATLFNRTKFAQYVGELGAPLPAKVTAIGHKRRGGFSEIDYEQEAHDAGFKTGV